MKPLEVKITNNITRPETLTWCRRHYVYPDERYITCKSFGEADGTNGGCWWCMEMTPYQWHMCQDETYLNGLLAPTARIKCKNRLEAIQFIEDRKQKHPMGNERKALLSNLDD